MSYLKAHSHWFGLVGATVISLAGTYFLFQAEQNLPGRLKELQPRPVKPKQVPSLDLTGLETASKLIANPGLWKTDYTTFLFVSEHYLLENGQPKRPIDGSMHVHSKTRQPIPNSWFALHKLPLFSARILLEDTDGDGFTNEEEWAAGTDPNNPNSHPKLLTKLQYVNQKVVNNRVKFLQYLGNPQKPETLKITVRPEDIAGATQYELKLGASIPGTDFSIKSFEFRRRRDPSSTVPVEASVVTFVENKTGRTETAEIRESANFTDRTLYFRLFYPKVDREISAKLGDKIVLDETESYELINADATSARLKSPDGTETELKTSIQ